MVTSPEAARSTWGIIFTTIEIVPMPPGISGLMAMFNEKELPWISMESLVPTPSR